MNRFAAIATSTLLMITGCRSPKAQSGNATIPPVPVAINQATEDSIPIQLRAVGTVEPYATVGIKAQVAGPIVGVKFTEGANVNRGDLLFEIDARPFQEALRQAEAAVAKDQAQLRVAEANLARSRAQLKNAQADAARIEQLSKEGITTRQQEDQIRTAADVAEQSMRGDEASIESIRAALESDRAAVEQAKLNLAYCQIRAPISGRAGNLLLHPGNLVQANGDNPLVVLNQIKPIFVSFGVPERYLNSIAQQQLRRKLPVEAAPGKESTPASGTLMVIDNTVDVNTGTIRLKAVFENTEARLWPGQFVNVVLTLDTQKAILIPSEAVQVGQQGSFVYIVKTDQTVEPRPVTVGQTVSTKIVVEKGLSAGETIVTDGQSRLFPGAKITPNPQAESRAN